MNGIGSERCGRFRTAFLVWAIVRMASMENCVVTVLHDQTMGAISPCLAMNTCRFGNLITTVLRR